MALLLKKLFSTVIGGDAELKPGFQQIDLRDLAAYDKIENSSGTLNVASSGSKLGHEISEAYQIQVKGLDYDKGAHQTGIATEEKIMGNGIKRVSDSPQMIDPTGNTIRSTRFGVTQNGLNSKVSLTIIQEKDKTTVQQRKAIR